MKPTTRLSIQDSNALRVALHSLADTLDAQVFVETGTHEGLGSTQVLLSIAEFHPITHLYTIEVSKTLHEKARRNLCRVPFVECMWGLSVGREEAAAFIQSDPLLLERGAEPDIFIDFLPDPVTGYLNELRGAVGGDGDLCPPEAVLARLVPEVRSQRPLFCLDSAGGMGLLEFQTTQQLMGSLPYGLWLDDINHVKHYRSMLRLQEQPSARIVGMNWDEGWLVASCNC